MRYLWTVSSEKKTDINMSLKNDGVYGVKEKKRKGDFQVKITQKLWGGVSNDFRGQKSK